MTNKIVTTVVDRRQLFNCPAGYYVSSSGFCEPVGYGYVSILGDTQRYPCQPGTYSDVMTGEKCQPCAPGTFARDAGAESCFYCPPGTFTVNTGAISCDICDPLYYDGYGSDFAVVLVPALHGSPKTALYCLEPLDPPVFGKGTEKSFPTLAPTFRPTPSPTSPTTARPTDNVNILDSRPTYPVTPKPVATTPSSMATISPNLSPTTIHPPITNFPTSNIHHHANLVILWPMLAIIILMVGCACFFLYHKKKVCIDHWWRLGWIRSIKLVDKNNDSTTEPSVLSMSVESKSSSRILPRTPPRHRQYGHGVVMIPNNIEDADDDDDYDDGRHKKKDSPNYYDMVAEDHFSVSTTSIALHPNRANFHLNDDEDEEDANFSMGKSSIGFGATSVWSFPVAADVGFPKTVPNDEDELPGNHFDNKDRVMFAKDS